MGTQIVGKSDSIEYSTPLKIVEPLIKEFGLTKDVCANSLNNKLPDYWTKEENALSKKWIGNCWMNPPFSMAAFAKDSLFSQKIEHPDGDIYVKGKQKKQNHKNSKP